MNRLISKVKIQNVETWVKNGDYHIPTENFDKPQEDVEYSNRILDFLNIHFGS